MHIEVKPVTENAATVAAFVMEQTMEPQKVNIVHVENRPGLRFVRGNTCFQTFNCWNRNKRNYFTQPMKETWGAPHIREMMKYGSFFGENGHPDSNDPKRIVTIDPKLCCHRIIDFNFRGDAVYGTFETLNDDMYGKQFMGHILQGCMAAFSFRGLVPLTKIDAVRCEVRSKGHMIAEDRVILPSHKEAYQTNDPVDLVVGESATFIPEGQSNSNKTVYVSEASGIPKEFLGFVEEQSFNVKTILDHFEVDCESMTLSKDGKYVTVKEGRDENGIRRTAVIATENYIHDEIRHMLSTLY